MCFSIYLLWNEVSSLDESWVVSSTRSCSLLILSSKLLCNWTIIIETLLDAESLQADAHLFCLTVIMKLRIHFSLLSLCDPGSYIIWFFYIPKLVIFHIWLLECTVRCVVDMLVYSYSLPPPCWEGYCIHRWQVETISWNTLSY